MRSAHDGSGRYRSLLGIGEEASLLLDLSGCYDTDLESDDGGQSWYPVGDFVTTFFFRNKPGSLGYVENFGVHDAGGTLYLNGFLTIPRYSPNAGTDASVQAVVDDSALYADDPPSVLDHSFTVVYPGSISAPSAAPWWAPARTPGTGTSWIGGHCYPFFNVYPQTVNWQDLPIRENIPAVSFNWPSGKADGFPEYINGGPVTASGGFPDNYATSPRDIKYLIGSGPTVFPVPQPGNMEYELESGAVWQVFSDWQHVDSFNRSTGVDTMQVGPSGAMLSCDQGPWASESDY